jgi:RNA polymerase sigma factor (sigma-70 family)
MSRYTPIPTRASLLDRLKNSEDRDSWQTFFNIYRKLIYGHAINAGLTEDEAQEVVQETLIEVSDRIKTFHYDARHGSFKAWLFQLSHWRITDQFRKRKSGDIPLHEVPLDDHRAGTSAGASILPWVEPDLRWEEEWRQAILEAAVRKVSRQMSAKHFQVFDLVFIKQWPVSKVMATLQINRGRVYLLKFRGIRLLKMELAHLKKGCV